MAPGPAGTNADGTGWRAWPSAVARVGLYLGTYVGGGDEPSATELDVFGR